MDDTSDGGTFRSIRNRLSFARLGPSHDRAADDPSGESAPVPRLSVVRGSENRSVYSKGVCRLDEFGHRLYNIEDGEEVYISRKSSKAMSGEDDLILIRATDGNFVVQPDTPCEDVGCDDAGREDPEALFGNVLGRTTRRMDIRGVVGTAREGRIALGFTGDRLMGKVSRTSFRERPDALPADYPDELCRSGCTDVDATTVSGIAVQKVQVSSTGCGFRMKDDDPDAGGRDEPQ